VIIEHIEAALGQARYEMIQDEEPYYGGADSWRRLGYGEKRWGVSKNLGLDWRRCFPLPAFLPGSRVSPL